MPVQILRRYMLFGLVLAEMEFGVQYRTVTRTSSIGALYVCAGGFTFVQGGLDIQIRQRSSNL